MRRRAVAVGALVLSGLAVSACGPPTPDLFVVQRFGVSDGARLRLLVSDTSIKCNDQERVNLTSAQILTGRRILEDLEEYDLDTSKPAIPRDGQLFTFSVRSEFGTIRFADRATDPDVLPRIARFTRTVAQDLCGLSR